MIAHLNSLAGKDRELFFHTDQKGLPTHRIETELTREESWLHTEENFRFIKEQLVSKDRLIAITEDITNFETFSRLRTFLDTNYLHIDTLYLSNICNFMIPSKQKNSFIKSIKQLLNQDMIFISCPQLKQLDNPKTTLLHQKLSWEEKS